MNRIDIPAEIKVGLVIGKNGAVCKSIRDQFNVKMFVDIPNHCVKLNGSPQNVAQAQRELLKMFQNFSLKGSSTYSHAKFFATALKDAQVAAPLDNADQSLNDVAISPRRNPWICNFDQVNILNLVEKVKKEIDPKASDENIKVKMVLGMARFKLFSATENQLYSYQQLHNMIIGEHMKFGWSGILNPKSTLALNLLTRLITESDHNDETYVLKIHLSNPKLCESYTLKYHYDKVSKKWILKENYCHRNMHALFSFRIDDYTWIRTRFFSRQKGDSDAKLIAEKYLLLPDFNEKSAQVKLTDQGVAVGLRIEETVLKSKKHVELFGIRFSLYYYKGINNQESPAGIPSIEARLAKPLSSPSETFQSLMGKFSTLFEIFPRPSIEVKDIDQPLSKSCMICFDNFAHDSNEEVGEDHGVVCGRGHTVCFECFESYLETEFAKEVANHYERKGKIICPYPDCKIVYTALQIVRCGEHIAAQWLKVFHRIGELEGVNSIRHAYAGVFQDLRNRVHDALNLSCPKCQAVFIDYDGCDAVKCNVCAQFFCGLCLQACLDSSDAHKHASSCGKNSGYFSGPEIKEEMHLKVKQEKVKLILKSITNEEKAWVMKTFGTLFMKEGIKI